jgi:hypothetical protein
MSSDIVNHLVCVYIYIVARVIPKLPLDNIYHILVVLLWFSHRVIDYQLTFDQIDVHQYPVIAACVYRHITHNTH